MLISGEPTPALKLHGWAADDSAGSLIPSMRHVALSCTCEARSASTAALAAASASRARCSSDRSVAAFASCCAAAEAASASSCLCVHAQIYTVALLVVTMLLASKRHATILPHERARAFRRRGRQISLLVLQRVAPVLQLRHLAPQALLLAKPSRRGRLHASQGYMTKATAATLKRVIYRHA